MTRGARRVRRGEGKRVPRRYVQQEGQAAGAGRKVERQGWRGGGPGRRFNGIELSMCKERCEQQETLVRR